MWQHGDAMRCDRLVDWWGFCICKKFASGNTNHTHEMTTRRCDAFRARNPRFYFVHAGTKVPGWHATKTQYNMRKTLEKKCNNIGFEPKLIITSPGGDLQRTRDYSNLGVIRTFHLNHFNHNPSKTDVRTSAKIFENESARTPCHILKRSLDGLWLMWHVLQRLFKWNVLHNHDLSTHVYAVSTDWL